MSNQCGIADHVTFMYIQLIITTDPRAFEGQRKMCKKDGDTTIVKSLGNKEKKGQRRTEKGRKRRKRLLCRL